MSRPSRRDRTRPAELLGLAAALALFVGLAVLLTTRDWLLAVEFFGAGFIVSIVVLSTLLLAVKPSHDDDADPPEAQPPPHG